MKLDKSAQVMRVLVVDDEALARKGLLLRLQELGKTEVLR